MPTLHKLIFRIAAGLALLVLLSCSTQEPQTEPTEEIKEKAQRRSIVSIGQVVTVNLQEQFVLMRVSNEEQARKYQLYYVETPLRRATLRPTGERMGRYLAADIVNGEVKPTDTVTVDTTFGVQNGPGQLTPLSEPAPIKPAAPPTAPSSQSQ